MTEAPTTAMGTAADPRSASASRGLARRAMGRRPLTVSALAVVVGVFVTVLAERHGYFDLHVYHGALNYWVHDGGLLYDYLLPRSTYGFTYPPFAALVMLPMAITPWHVAIVISCVMCLVTTVILLYWLVDPVARREGWTRWYALALALCFAAAFEPLRETFLFGQVNMLLVFLVAVDLVLLVGRGSRWAGVVIGLATAIKLTPGIFIVYLLITRRWRAAAVASVTAAVATLVSAAVAPDSARAFWTDALWNTDRVGDLAFISNQSLNGAVARLNPGDPSTALWLAGVVAILAVWVVRVRQAAAAGDELTGFALTGIAGCLISPVSWIHHLVWVGPAIVLLLDRALAAPTRQRRNGLLTFMIFSYGLLCSRFVWDYHNRFGEPLNWFLSNAYVWISLALLVALPVRARVSGQGGSVGATMGRAAGAGVAGSGVAGAGVADAGASGGGAAGDGGTGESVAGERVAAANFGEFDREIAGLLEGERAPATRRREPPTP